MATILVGGRSKNAGKTTLVCNIIAALPELGWNAVKITNHQHDVRGCVLRIKQKSWSIWEGTYSTESSDTALFLRAGAKSAFLVQSEDADLEGACAGLRNILSADANVIAESTRAGGILKPDLFLLVINAEQLDTKNPAQQRLELVDAVVLREGTNIAVRDLPPKLQGKSIFAALRQGIDPKLLSLISEVITRL
jgi:hypothetical protein